MTVARLDQLLSISDRQSSLQEQLGQNGQTTKGTSLKREEPEELHNKTQRECRL
jgi:hypothetical protein